MTNKIQLEKEVLHVLQQGIQESIKSNLVGYSSPLIKFVNEVVLENEQELKTILREALSGVVSSEEFKTSVREAFLHKIGRTLVDQLDGSVKQAAEKLRQNPTIKAQMILAIQRIVDENSVTSN